MIVSDLNLFRALLGPTKAYPVASLLLIPAPSEISPAPNSRLTPATSQPQEDARYLDEDVSVRQVEGGIAHPRQHEAPDLTPAKAFIQVLSDRLGRFACYERDLEVSGQGFEWPR